MSFNEPYSDSLSERLSRHRQELSQAMAELQNAETELEEIDEAEKAAWDVRQSDYSAEGFHEAQEARKLAIMRAEARSKDLEREITEIENAMRSGKPI